MTSIALRPEFPRRTPTDLRVIISSRVIRRELVLPITLQQVDFVEKVALLIILQTQAFLNPSKRVTRTPLSCLREYSYPLAESGQNFGRILACQATLPTTKNRAFQDVFHTIRVGSRVQNCKILPIYCSNFGNSGVNFGMFGMGQKST